MELHYHQFNRMIRTCVNNLADFSEDQPKIINYKHRSLYITWCFVLISYGKLKKYNKKLKRQTKSVRFNQTRSYEYLLTK